MQWIWDLRETGQLLETWNWADEDLEDDFLLAKEEGCRSIAWLIDHCEFFRQPRFCLPAIESFETPCTASDCAGEAPIEIVADRSIVTCLTALDADGRGYETESECGSECELKVARSTCDDDSELVDLKDIPDEAETEITGKILSSMMVAHAQTTDTDLSMHQHQRVLHQRAQRTQRARRPPSRLTAELLMLWNSPTQRVRSKSSRASRSRTASSCVDLTLSDDDDEDL